MKIVVKGTNPNDVPFNLECYKCGTIIELTANELKYQGGDSGGGDSGKYVKCPTCANTIWDTPEARQKTALKLKQKADQDRIKESNYRSDWGDDDKPRSGGPSGPLPPPELPHCVKFVKALAIPK